MGVGVGWRGWNKARDYLKSITIAKVKQQSRKHIVFNYSNGFRSLYTKECPLMSIKMAKFSKRISLWLPFSQFFSLLNCDQRKKKGHNNNRAFGYLCLSIAAAKAVAALAYRKTEMNCTILREEAWTYFVGTYANQVKAMPSQSMLCHGFVLMVRILIKPVYANTPRTIYICSEEKYDWIELLT